MGVYGKGQLKERSESLLYGLMMCLETYREAAAFWQSKGFAARWFNVTTMHYDLEQFGQPVFNLVVQLGGDTFLPSSASYLSGVAIGYDEYHNAFAQERLLDTSNSARAFDVLNAPTQMAEKVFNAAVRCMQSAISAGHRELIGDLFATCPIARYGLAGQAKFAEIYFSADAFKAVHRNGLVLDTGEEFESGRRVCLTDVDLDSAWTSYVEPEFMLTWVENDDGSYRPGEAATIMGSRGRLIPADSDECEQMIDRIVASWCNCHFE